jgi:hypothetical protein
MPKLTFAALWDGQALLLSPDTLLAEEDLPPAEVERTWNWWWSLPIALVVGAGVWWFGLRRG